jgi:phospholipid/cholesterol/gamma-HCH transport system substrate-binding protein
MKKENVNYFMVGLFVIAMLLLLVAMLYRITGQQSGAENYSVVFDKVSGLKDGAAVTYGGYQIGQVASVTPLMEQAHTRYQLQLAIRGDWKIPDDSVAQIIMPGLIADKQVEISEGQSTQYLPPGGRIAATEAVDMMALLNSVGTELNRIIPNLATDIARLLKNLNYSAEQLAAMMNRENRQHVDSLFRNADEASANLVELAAGFDRVNSQLDEILQRSKAMLVDNDEDIRHSIVELRRAMDVVSGNIHGVMYNLESSSRNLNEFTRQLRDNPGVIISSKPPVDKAAIQQ